MVKFLAALALSHRNLPEIKWVSSAIYNQKLRFAVNCLLLYSTYYYKECNQPLQRL